MRASVLFILVGCQLDPATGNHQSDLAIREHLDRGAEPQILGSSTDRRLVAYAVGCGQEDPAELRFVDAWTGEVTVLGAITFCMPGSVRFSPDGEVVAWGNGEGVVRAYSRRTGRLVQLSARAIGVDWSPDSRWVVVANAAEEQPLSSTLEAWDADLATHVTISNNAFYSPFQGPMYQNIHFSPDGRRLLYITNLGGRFPIGALTLWDRARHTNRELATGVMVTAYVVSDDWRRIAYQHGVVYVPGTPQQDWQHGPIDIADLATGAIEPVEADTSGTPVAFAGRKLVYQVATSFTPQSLELRVHDASGNRVIDSDIMPAFGGPAAAVVVVGNRAAYATAFDPQTFSGDLRLVDLSRGAPRTIAHHVIPQAFGFVDGGAALVYLHDPESTFPGAAMGTLSARIGGATQDLGQHVTQINLHFDPASANLLFVADYDMELAAGTLSSWNSRARTVKAIIPNAAVISVQPSPDGTRVGALTVVRNDPDLPLVSLAVGWVRGPLPLATVAHDVRGLALGDLGRVVYTTPTSVDGAWVF